MRLIDDLVAGLQILSKYDVGLGATYNIFQTSLHIEDTSKEDADRLKELNWKVDASGYFMIMIKEIYA